LQVDDWDSANAGVSASQRKISKKVDSTIASTPPRQSRDVPEAERWMLRDRKANNDTKAVAVTPDTAASTPPAAAASRTTRKEIPSSYISIITDTYGVSADLYALLQVPRTATARDIRISYFRRGRQVLTDTRMANGAATSATVGGVSEQAKMRFQAVSMAYEILSDEHMRATYDAYGLQAHSEDDAFVDYYSGNKAGSPNSPVADLKEVMIKPTERVRSGVRWNEEVEELVFEKDKYEMGGSLNDSIQALSGSDDSSSDGSQRRQRMKKGRRKKKRSKKKKIVVVDNDELNRHLEQLDDEYDNAKANEKDYVNDYLDALETSIDGLLSWNPPKAKERDNNKKAGGHDSEAPTTDDDDSSIEPGIRRPRGPPPPRSSKTQEKVTAQNEFGTIELSSQPVMQNAPPRMTNNNEKNTNHDYSSNDVVPNNKTNEVMNEEILDSDSVSAMSLNAFPRASPVAPHVPPTSQDAAALDPKLKDPRVVVEDEDEVPMDEPTVQSTSLSSRQGSRTSVATEDVGNCQRWCGDGDGDGSAAGDGDLKFAANWLLAGDGHMDTSVVSQEELSRELKDTSLLSASSSNYTTEEAATAMEQQDDQVAGGENQEEESTPATAASPKPKDVAEMDMVTDFAAYLFNYLRAITDEVTKCATAVASSEIFDSTRDVFQSITVSDDDLSNMLGILKREMDRTPMPN